MIIDNTLNDIIIEIQNKVKTKYNIDLTTEQVVEIIDVQLSATVFGFARNVPIYWKGFLKFIHTNRRERAKEKKELFDNILDKDNNLTDKERAYYYYLARATSHAKFKELQTLGINAKALSVDELKATPTKSIHFKNFQLLLQKKKK